MNNKEWKKWLFWFTFAVAAIVVYKIIDSLSGIVNGLKDFFNLIMPFFMALLIAYILYIPCKNVEGTIKKTKFKVLNKHARGLSVLIVYLIVILLIFIVINFIIPAVTSSVADLAENLPNYYNSAMEYIDNADEDSILVKLNVDEYVQSLQEINIGKELVKWINLDNINSYIKGIMGAANIIFDAFVTTVVSIYLLLERGQIKNFLVKVSRVTFDKKTNMAIDRYYKRTNSIFFHFISGQIFDAFIIGIITSIAMSIMGIKYAVLLGFMIGIFNIIPYFGAIIAVTIAIIITIFTGGFVQAIWLAIIVIVLQQIDANIINPRILGNSLDLSPILVIFSVTLGGAYFGVLGMFLGVPIMAFLKLLIEDIIEYKEQKGFLEKNYSKQ